MTLDDFLKQPGAPTTAEFAASLGFHEGQVRQWRHGYGSTAGGKPRQPSPENCVVIEKATAGKVTRRDLRPDDWARIWPELDDACQKKKCCRKTAEAPVAAGRKDRIE